MFDLVFPQQLSSSFQVTATAISGDFNREGSWMAHLFDDKKDEPQEDHQLHDLAQDPVLADGRRPGVAQLRTMRWHTQTLSQRYSVTLARQKWSVSGEYASLATLVPPISIQIDKSPLSMQKTLKAPRNVL